MLKSNRRFMRCGASLILLFAAVAMAGAQTPAAQSSTPGMATPRTAAADVIAVLDQTVDWYRTLGLQQQAASEPSDMLILYDNRQTADKVIALAFEIARADADTLASVPLTAADSGSDALSSLSLLQLQKKLDTQGTSVQVELDAERAKLTTAAKATDVEVRAKINELQGELDLVNTKKSILATMMSFTTGGAGSNGSALKSQIDAMAVAIPSAASASQTPVPSPPQRAATTLPATVGRFGLWDLATNAFRLSEKAGTIDTIDRRTAALQTTLTRNREPLLTHIKALSAEGDALAAEADTADSATLNGVHDKLDALAGQFKQSSALLIPLSREGILLNQYRRNLNNWRDTVRAQYRAAVKTLAIRVAILLVILGLLFAGAEVWRRTVMRYVQDFRRRYQLLLLQRIAFWSMVVLLMGIAFASELGSIGTFAGLITAGIAVAMQSVLVSMVGYFFLIGKYGIRVGDRIQIGDVTGEVIELGFVRMYLMELNIHGGGPTGRVVAFPNSVVFQVSGGLFKQIPGVNLTWREVTLSLPSGVDYAATKQKLMTAVTAALAEYRPELLRQKKEIDDTLLSGTTGEALPQVQLRFSATGVEGLVRYPVTRQDAAEIDERMTEALADVIRSVTHAPATASAGG